MDFVHRTVLLEETIKHLNIKPDGVYVDATLGGGGHSLGILRRLGREGRLIGIDRDENAVKAADERLAEFSNRVQIVHGNFKDIHRLVNDCGITAADGIVMDLGVSSHQLDRQERGFSYKADAPLDMRMDRQQRLSAMEVVNQYDETEIAGVIRKYGEERWAKRIASFIVKERERNTIMTTGQLVDIIKAAIPAAARRKGPHPAKRTFQAIRIEVNDELNILQKAVKDGVRLLNRGGRICVITFHSLEDRLIKHIFKELENPCICPPGAPVCVCGKRPMVRIVNRKPITPNSSETEANPRARSAGLRVAEKV